MASGVELGEETVVELAKLQRSIVKGHHVYRNGTVGDRFSCSREPYNAHSPFAIVAMLDANGEVLGHVPDRMAQGLAPLLDSGEVARMEGTITGPSRSAPEGTWVSGGGLEHPCQYVLFGNKKYRPQVRQILRGMKIKKEKD